MNAQRLDTRTVLTLGLISGVLLGVTCAWLYLHFLEYRSFGAVGLHTLGPIYDGLTPERMLKASYVFCASLAITMFGAFVYTTMQPKNPYGDARLATEAELVKEKFACRLTPEHMTLDDILWGKFGPPKKRTANFLKTSVFAHGFLASPTGAGKGVGFVIPNLLHFNGSIVCLDVKGENFKKTSRHRAAMGDRVIHFAPFDPDQSHCYNPLTEIESLEDPDRQYVELTKLANYFIEDDPKLKTWLSGCRRYFSATAMLALERGNATMGGIKDMLDGATPETFKEFAREVRQAQAKGEFLNGAQAEPKRLNDYLDILRDSGLGLWGNPYIRRVTAKNDFSFSELRRIPTSIYLVCPEDDMKAAAPLIRLFFQHLSGVLHRAEPRADEPFKVLFLLDEFDKLGKMDTIIEAYKTIRSYGGRIVVITQSLSQLFEIYGRDAVKGFVSNAGMRGFAATSDLEAAQMISEVIGDRTHTAESRSRNIGTGLEWFGSKSKSVKDEALRLIKVQDVTSLAPDKLIIVRSPLAPVIIDKIRYYDDSYFKGIFEAQEGQPWPYPKQGAPRIVTVSPVKACVAETVDPKGQGGELSEEKEVQSLLDESEDLSGDPFMTPAMRAKSENGYQGRRILKTPSEDFGKKA